MFCVCSILDAMKSKKKAIRIKIEAESSGFLLRIVGIMRKAHDGKVELSSLHGDRSRKVIYEIRPQRRIKEVVKGGRYNSSMVG